jgi:hypothetical protein
MKDTIISAGATAPDLPSTPDQQCYLSPIGVNPGADGILGALEDMQREDMPRKEG